MEGHGDGRSGRRSGGGPRPRRAGPPFRARAHYLVVPARSAYRILYLLVVTCCAPCCASSSTSPSPPFCTEGNNRFPGPAPQGAGPKPPCQCGKPRKQAQKPSEISTGVWRRNRISPPLMPRTSVRVHHQKAREPLIHRASISPFGDAFNPGALGQHRIQDKAV